MLKVIVTKGLPGSGKSTYAKNLIKENPGSYKRINKDDLRRMLDNSHFSKLNEKFILKIRNSLILSALENKNHVIVDDTNLNPIHIEDIKLLISGKAELVIKDFTNIPLETCIKQDLQRLNSVGEKVIKDMYNKFIKINEVYIEDKNHPKAILVDIDGTLAIMGNRSPFEWNKVKNDTCNEAVKSIVNNYNGTVIVFSGRDEICKQDTIQWLNDNNIKFDHIFMREHNNNEKDSIIKRRLFEQNIRNKFYIEYVLDDRISVCRMWHQIGLQLLRVGDPDADF